MVSDNGKSFIGAEREFKEFESKIELKNIFFNKGLYGRSIHLHHPNLEESGSYLSGFARKQCMQCWGTDQFRKMFSQP